jgi:hypothetical protein
VWGRRLFRRRPRASELFVFHGLLCLVWAAVWLVWSHELLLEYFYFSRLLALTHLVTLGFLTSLMMGVLHRLSPMLLKVEARSPAVTRWQLGLFLIGTWGMVSHFWIGEWTGMSWSTFLLWAASVLQIWNFAGLFATAKKDRWARRFVAASLVNFFLAATLGVLLGLLKAYDVRPPFFSTDFLDNVFAHAHLAALGWVAMMIFGFELKLVPTTGIGARSLGTRFWLIEVGTLGLAGCLLMGVFVLPFALMIAVAVIWQLAGPARSLIQGKAREWELVPLLFLLGATVLGVGLALGWPNVEEPARARVQLAYGFLALVGFMVTTVVSVAFKLFPMWAWKERFQEHFGRKPVPGMKELASERLRVAANAGVAAGSLGTALGILFASGPTLLVATATLALGVGCFVVNFARVVRWALLDVEFHPSAADVEKFEQIWGQSPET